MRIEVVGGIASGKSTLVAMLGRAGVQPVVEEFSKNPFFDKFYSDPNGYAFEAEITYLLQHYSAVKHIKVGGNTLIAADFSLVLDLAYALVTLTPEDRGTFGTVLERAVQKVGLPHLLVKLDCSVEVELERIRARHRPAEQAVEAGYLQALNSATERALRDPLFQEVPVIRIDSQALDFRDGGKDAAVVRGCILAACLPHDA